MRERTCPCMSVTPWISLISRQEIKHPRRVFPLYRLIKQPSAKSKENMMLVTSET